jgi:5-methyltetrahydropteroyltriglutamate--homocysteine methyltransferase
MTATVQSAGSDLLARPLLTHELGSLAKPNWRVKAISGSPIDDLDLEEARSWGARLAVPDYEELLELLRRPELDAAAKQRIRAFSSVYGVRLLEHAGVEVVYDGEQQRSEMYAWAVAHSDGFEQRGDVRAFDNKYYAKAAVTGPLSVREPFHDQEFGFVDSVADSTLKIPITGPYTIADWSFDERYDTATDLSVPAAERQLILDIARNLIRPNLESLIGLGASWIQIDEPGASTEPDELDLFVEGFNQSVEGADAVFSTHLCFSDYDLFFPAIEAMTGCQQFAVGFANDDGRELGVSAERRPGYRVIPKFRDLPHRPALGLGVLDIHTDFIEPPELVRDRVLYAVEVFGDPSRIHVTPDCGLRTRTWSVAHQKLANMTAGVELAKRELGI